MAEAVYYSNGVLVDHQGKPLPLLAAQHPETGASGIVPSAGEYLASQGGGSSQPGGYSDYQRVAPIPIYIGHEATFVAMGCYVDTAVASAVVRLGIYASAPTQRPAQLLYDFGTVSAATTGAKEVAISQKLASGLYWLAASLQVATGAALRAFKEYTHPFGQVSPNLAQTTAAPQTQWRIAGSVTTGALPASPTWEVYAGTGFPILALKV